MPPSATAYAAVSAELALRAGDAQAAASPAGLWFDGVPITETRAFPPEPAAQCWVYLTLNAEIALSLPNNPALQRLVQQPRVRVSVDGQWLWWALRRKYPQQPLVKLSGSDLIYQLAAHCERYQRRLLLLGSTPQLNARALAKLRQLHTSLQVHGFSPEPYRLDDAERTASAEAAALSAIRTYEPDFVVMGLGADKEQHMALELAPQLDGHVAGLLCFGGAIDMVSGQVRRAAPWMQVAGLESLYRVWQQPRRFPRLLRVLRIVPRLLTGGY